MARLLNFSAGPSTLPLPVLETVARDLVEHPGAGMSVMEMSHRSAAFEAILADAEADLRTLLAVPADYAVLFLQGGASLQFAMAPMNLLNGGEAAYVVTGTWGEKAVESAKPYGNPDVVWSGKSEGYRSAPSGLHVESTPAYVHTTTNETIQGVRWSGLPETSAPVVTDASSDFLAAPMDVARFGLIYAGAQKNAGPAGVTIVLVRRDLLDRIPDGLPPMLDYRVHAKNGSLYNTPPTFGIYVCGLVFRYLLDLGGLAAAAARNERKSRVLYDSVDASEGFYTGHAAPDSRSTMNVTFTLPDAERTRAFLAGAAERGMDGLPGHRSVGGVRASIYNAFPEDGCLRLADWMNEFRRRA